MSSDELPPPGGEPGDADAHALSQPAEAPRATATSRFALLPEASRAATLLAAVGASAVLGAYLLANLATVPEIVRENAIAWETRKVLAGCVGVAAALGALAPLLVWCVRPGLCPRVESIARRLAPIVPLSFVPALAHWGTWKERPLAQLALLGVLMIGLHRAVLVATGEPRIVRRWPGEAFFVRLAGTRAFAHVPTGLVFLGAAGYAAYFGFYTIQAHRHGQTLAYDLAIFDNLHWQAVNGGGFLHSSPAATAATGPDMSHFGRHATFLVYVFAPIYALHPNAETLLALQAALLGGGAIPLYFLARRKTSAWVACLLAYAYLLYAPLHGSNSYDFHYLSTAPIFVFALAWAIEHGNEWAIAITTLLTLACREDVALAVGILGAYYVLTGRKPRLGLGLVAAGAGTFALLKFVLMPMTPGAESFSRIYEDLVPEGGHEFRGVLTTLITNPVFAFGFVPTVPKIVHLLQVMLPVALLPLRRPIGYLFCLPGLVFNLLSTDFGPSIALSFQYTAFWTPYVFVATVFILGDDFADASRAAHRRRVALLCALALGAWGVSYQHGGILQQHTLGSGFRPHFVFHPTAEMREDRELRDAMIATIPRDASAGGTEPVVPHLSNRKYAFTLRAGIFDAEYLLLKRRALSDIERRTVGRLLTRGEVGLEAMNRGYVLLRRGAPTAENPRVHRVLLGRPMSEAARARFEAQP